MKMMKILQAKLRKNENDENSTGKIYAKMKMMKILQAKSTVDAKMKMMKILQAKSTQK